jgi:hypothetical protein
MNSKTRMQKRNAVLVTAAIVVSLLPCESGRSRSSDPLRDRSPVLAPTAGGGSSGQANPTLERSAQATVSARTILGKWRCEGNFLGASVVVIVSYTAGNYRTVMAYQGHQIIVGGTYKASPSGANSLSVSYRPSDWRPREICSGPGGVGGNCVPLNFEPSTEQLLFQGPDGFEAPLGACHRLR